MNYKNKFLTLLLTLISLTTFSQDLLFVDVDAAGANDGSTWTDAFTNIQTAVDNWTTGDSIWVAGGTYILTFQISINQDGTKLFGGFEGTETSFSERNMEDHPTILSGNNSNSTIFEIDGSTAALEVKP